MILPDTSAWIEYDRRTASRVSIRLADLIRSQADLAVTEPVTMEVLAGARTDRRASELRHMLSPLRLLSVQAQDFESAARTYRHCRRAGITPRGMLDCLIAAIAWRNGAALLSNDEDMVRIAGVLGIDLDPASR